MLYTHIWVLNVKYMSDVTSQVTSRKFLKAYKSNLERNQGF